jgi:hypothetical protein
VAVARRDLAAHRLAKYIADSLSGNFRCGPAGVTWS